MRSKEEAHDYRYFPDPDLLPVELTDEYIAAIRKTLPELPWEKRARFQKDYQLNEYDAKLVASSIETATYFENTIKAAEKAAPKLIANWINGELAAALNKSNLNITESPVTATQLANLVNRIADNTLSTTMAKQVFEALWNNEGGVDEIIKKKGLKQITDTGEIEKIIDEIINNNPQQVEQYRAGKDKLFAFFIGQVMKATRGKANPQQVNEILRKKLGSSVK